MANRDDKVNRRLNFMNLTRTTFVFRFEGNSLKQPTDFLDCQKEVVPLKEMVLLFVTISYLCRLCVVKCFLLAESQSNMSDIAFFRR